MEMMLVWDKIMKIYDSALEDMPEDMVLATIGMSIDYLCAKTGRDSVEFAKILADVVEQVNEREGKMVV